MGRRNKRRRLNIVTALFALLFIQNICFSQTKIFGSIKDDTNKLYSVSIILKDSLSNSIIAYSYSDVNGNYKIETAKLGKYNLVFSSLGYVTKTIPLSITKEQKDFKVDIVLKDKAMILDEVIIKADLPMTIKEDTISFKTKFYVRGNEQTVEDLLKTIPGININTDGTIKIGNQEIEKLMIDGDDLFERGYKILSKNMPAYPIEEVEVLKNYSNNRLLKGVEESSKVALNLKLDEKSKRIWFGNIETSIGNNNLYQLKGNLMNFGKKNKYYFLANLNNIGYDATGDIENLVRPFRINEPASIGDNRSVNSLLNLSPESLNFKQNRTNFNNAELVSLNAIFNPTEKIKIKTLGFFNWDETDFFRNSVAITDVNGTNFTNTQDFELRNKNRVAFGKLDFTYNISKTKMLEATTKYNNGDFNDNSNLVFNGSSTIENLQHQNTLFDQKISYTNKFKDKKVFLLTGRFIDEKAPQNYTINQFFYQDLFPSFTNTNNVKQQNTNQMRFAGVNAHLLDRKTNGHLLEFQLGNEYRKDKLTSEFSLLEDNSVLNKPNGYQNRTSYQVNDLYVKSKYRLKINDFGIVGKLNIHQLFNRLENNNISSNQKPFFVNPSLGFDWKINDKNKIISSYSYNTTNARVLDVFSDFVLTGFRSFSKGTDSFNQLDASSLVFNYQLGNWSDRFFANTFILYSKNHDFFSTNTIIEQNFTQADKILIKDREFISVNSKLDYYFKFISSNLKLDLGYSKSEFKNIVNNSNLRQVNSNNYNYGLELRSGFKGVFNYHIGTKWTTTEIETTVINSFTDNVSFLDLSFVFNKKIDIQIQSERYYFGNLQTDNTYYFLDFDARYKLIENKLTLGLTGKNLFNTERFRNFSVSDIGTSTTEYRLLPRFVLLKLEYRF
ncbi:TonB-dependent receptor [Bizionia argentinensis JUB59]|uniref:TonB-dependent receptor n=1 Tax=Bizionia argentinensis JUB59 TaxID=1046627 RepID=G2EE78_9FLAO|nr:carboxypeptidase-like regulatory domain-containing protein [Bizionia argentinensis]EGV43303.1 TonB-dependent receptor [Bizionia argentinensis JUB59]